MFIHLSLIGVFFALVVGHCLADYPLQGDFLARGKNRFNPIPGVPWYQCMAAHCIIHAGVVGLITGSTVCAIAELTFHLVIDSYKCANEISYDSDQLIHILCKLVYVCWIAGGMTI